MPQVIFIGDEEQRLVKRLQEGDKTATREFYSLYADTMAGICSRYIADEEDLKDVFQDALVHIFTHIDGFRYRGTGSLEAYLEFMPLDGQFADNVIIQIKNGPVDFQPREPYSPLFTAMQKTPMMVEFQITQEYLGAANHLVYLAPMWQEFFSFVKPQSLKAMAGVANIGDNVNWCGHHFAQANWYAFGRLAWNPNLTSEEIANEWLYQTMSRYVLGIPMVPALNPEKNEKTWGPLIDMMMSSREACVSYMMPCSPISTLSVSRKYSASSASKPAIQNGGAMPACSISRRSPSVLSHQTWSIPSTTSTK